MSVWQIEIRGKRFGDGTPFIWTEDRPPQFFGWDSPRTADQDAPGEHGARAAGRDLLGGDSRPMVLPFTIMAGGPGEVLNRYEVLNTAFMVGDTAEMTLRTPGWARTTNVRVRRVAIDEATFMEQGVAPVAVELARLDPYWYDPELRIDVPIGVTSGGRMYPYDYPYRYGTATPGRAVLETTGNAITKPRLVIFSIANITNPLVRLVETGEAVVFDGLTVLAGLYLVIDFATGDAVIRTNPDSAVGEQDATGYIDRTLSAWWTGSRSLPAGGASVDFSGGGNGTMAVLYRSAWLI